VFDGMEVLELKPVKRKVNAYMVAKDDANYFQNNVTSQLEKFLKERKINFVTVDFEVNMKEFSNTKFAQTLNELKIPYYQVDIPEYAMGYFYEEIVEKEELLDELVQEFTSMEDKDSYKGQSLKNWIDMLNEEIQKMEIFLSLRLRPQWIVKKMLEFVKNSKTEEVSFVHFVQKDICEDICTQVVEQLRDLNVKVIQYNKKHTIQKITF
jgi:hypothetical protein